MQERRVSGGRGRRKAGSRKSHQELRVTRFPLRYALCAMPFWFLTPLRLPTFGILNRSPAAPDRSLKLPHFSRGPLRPRDLRLTAFKPYALCPMHSAFSGLAVPNQAGCRIWSFTAATISLTSCRYSSMCGAVRWASNSLRPSHFSTMTK